MFLFGSPEEQAFQRPEFTGKTWNKIPQSMRLHVRLWEFNMTPLVKLQRSFQDSLGYWKAIFNNMIRIPIYNVSSFCMFLKPSNFVYFQI